MLQNELPEINENPLMPLDGLESLPAPEQIIEEIKATYKSNLAPLWLVFPKYIFNTQSIICMQRLNGSIKIETRDGHTHTILVSDIDKTWSSLQKVFSEGLSSE